MDKVSWLDAISNPPNTSDYVLCSVTYTLEDRKRYRANMTGQYVLDRDGQMKWSILIYDKAYVTVASLKELENKLKVTHWAQILPP